jgi:DNA-binding XRE family transcriptional regulator
MVAEPTDPAETDPSYILIGRAFADIRGAKSRRSLAKTRHLSASTIKSIEAGEVGVSVRSHRALADVLGTTLKEVHRRAAALDPEPDPATLERLRRGVPDLDRELPLLQMVQKYADLVAQLLRVILGDPRDRSRP